MRLRAEPETLIKSISEMLHEFEVNPTDAAEGIEYILDNKLWMVRNPSPGLLEEKTYKYFPEFCEAPTPWGLKTKFETVVDVCRRNDRVYHKVVEAGKQKGFKGNQHVSSVYNINEATPIKGTSKSYGLSRLNKYRPDLYEAVIEKEMSVNEAMIEAGFREKTYTVKADQKSIVKFIKKHFSKDERQEIARNILRSSK